MRWIQHPVTHKLIPADEYVRPANSSAVVHDDIGPFVSPVDGSVIGSRTDLREHNLRNNVVQHLEMGTNTDAVKRREAHFKGERTTSQIQSDREQINEVINHLERNQR